MVEDVIDHQITRLTAYKESFPNGTPTAALRDAIGYLRFAMSFEWLRLEYVRAYPAVDQLLLECAQVCVCA